MASLLKNTAIYGLGTMAQKGVSFFLVFLFTHYLSPADIGIINTLQVFSVIYVFFLSFGLERSLYRLYHDYKDEESKRNFLGTINIGIVGISLIVVLLTFLFKNAVSRPPSRARSRTACRSIPPSACSRTRRAGSTAPRP